MHTIYVTGGTGYMGQRLIPLLLRRGHRVRALVRNASRAKLPADCECVKGNVLDHRTFASTLQGCDTLIHLVGVSHPGPGKEQLFIDVDKKSIDEVIAAALNSDIHHIIYLSVAHPAPVMTSYWKVRRDAEQRLQTVFTQCTFLRPWYVLGPGHRWAVITKPLYALASLFPSARSTARRLQLVNIHQMLNALLHAVERTDGSVCIMTAEDIRAMG